MKKQRRTRQRQLVLNAVKARRGHPSADEIYQDVRAIDSKISRGTVYRNLNVLVKQGEILQVKLPHKDRYECARLLHYHFICSSCGIVADVPLPYYKTLDIETAKKSGFSIKKHQIIFEGICTNCQQGETKSD